MSCPSPIDPRAVRFAVVIPVGPSTIEHERTLDLLESLWFYEPHVSRILVIDDGAEERPFPRPPTGSVAVERMTNPRNGRGIGITGGLCAGMLAGVKRFAGSEPPIDFVVKLDTDALVIAPFSAKLAALFSRQDNAGIAGAYRRTPNGEPRDFSQWRELLNDLKSRWIPSRRRRARAGRDSFFALRGRPAKMRRQVRDAMRAGYEAGENILGGSYAIAAHAIDKMNSRGLLDDPFHWLDTALGEDVLLAMLVKSVGLELVDFCSDNEPFGVRYRGLADTPQRLVDRGFSIIHSTKNDPNVSESEIRAFFRNRRAHASRVRQAS
jgi:hypothetical protein